MKIFSILFFVLHLLIRVLELMYRNYNLATMILQQVFEYEEILEKQHKTVNTTLNIFQGFSTKPPTEHCLRSWRAS